MFIGLQKERDEINDILLGKGNSSRIAVVAPQIYIFDGNWISSVCHCVVGDFLRSMSKHVQFISLRILLSTQVSS